MITEKDLKIIEKYLKMCGLQKPIKTDGRELMGSSGTVGRTLYLNKQFSHHLITVDGNVLYDDDYEIEGLSIIFKIPIYDTTKITYLLI